MGDDGEDDADEEEDGGDFHREPAAVLVAEGSSEEAGNKGCEVERGSEELERLVVIFAVVVLLHMVLPHIH